MIENIFYNDILFNIYRDIHIIVKDHEDIGNLMIYYLKKIIYIINSNKYKNKSLIFSKILEKLYNELVNIYYNEDINENYKIKTIYKMLNTIKNDEDIIKNHIKLLKTCNFFTSL